MKNKLLKNFTILLFSFLIFSCSEQQNNSSTRISYKASPTTSDRLKTPQQRYKSNADIYKTPSGKKYHLASCRMVENVSKKLLTDSDISEYNLKPCKICKPPSKMSFGHSYSDSNKAVGESKSVRCQGRTKKGTRCKHKTRIANGYCYQHTSQGH